MFAIIRKGRRYNEKDIMCCAALMLSVVFFVGCAEKKGEGLDSSMTQADMGV